MNKESIACIIVDDEPIARRLLAGFISQIDHLNCIGEFKNAIESIVFLENKTEPILVFLDINMPGLSGLSMAKIIKAEHNIIFTTAYSEYAVESYEYNAIDYLLKPFKFERFLQAVLKVTKKSNLVNNSIEAKEAYSDKREISIKSRGEKFLIQLKNISYCEAQKNYTKIFLANGENSYTSLISITKFEEGLKLKSNSFIRVHRSYIVSKKHISSLGANFVMIAGKKIPIGPQYKESFYNQFNIDK